MKKQTIEQKVSKVFDGATANSWLVHLNEKQAETFIDYIVDESVILKQAKVLKMTKPTQKIAELDIDDEIFVPWVRWVETQEHIKARAMTKELVSKEITATVRIFDDELQDNLEWNAFKDHLFKMIAKKGANQLEKVSLYSKKVENPKNLMGMFNWFISDIETKGNVIDATLEKERYISRNILSKARKNIPSNLIDRVNALFMPDHLKWDYEDLHISTQNNVPTDRIWPWKFESANVLGRGRAIAKLKWASTTLTARVDAKADTITIADESNFTEGMTIAIALGQWEEHITKIKSISGKNITLETPVPYEIDNSIENKAKVVEVETDGLDVLLTPKDNMIYGIQKDITLEADRMPKLRATDYVITARIDMLLLNPSASCVIKWLKAR